MITVAILINGQPTLARSARNVSGKGHDSAKFADVYAVDDGTRLEHWRKDGAVKLAAKLLKTIKE